MGGLILRARIFGWGISIVLVLRESAWEWDGVCGKGKGYGWDGNGIISCINFKS
jgi:hypothetical protein